MRYNQLELSQSIFPLNLYHIDSVNYHRQDLVSLLNNSHADLVRFRLLTVALVRLRIYSDQN